jgi:hypothetical protein
MTINPTLSAALSDLTAHDRAGSEILKRKRSAHPCWRALQSDARWQAIERENEELLRSAERGGVPEPLLAELRMRAAVLAADFGVPFFGVPTVESSLRDAAQQVDLFIEELGLHFETGPLSFVSLSDAEMPGSPSHAASYTPDRLYRALEFIEDSFRLMPLRDERNGVLPDSVWGRWASGTWTAPKPFDTVVAPCPHDGGATEQLRPCVGVERRWDARLATQVG